MAGALVGAAVLGTVVSAIGAIKQGNAAKNQADAQAQVQRQQAASERAKAQLEASDFRKKSSAVAARNRAAQGASGLQIGTGSSLLAEEDFAAEADIQQKRIQLGGAIRGSRLENQARLTQAAGKSAKTASLFRAGSTVLSGVSRAGSSFGAG